MKKIVSLLAVAFLLHSAWAQKIYSSKTGQAWFDAGTGMEDITGTNKSVTCAFKPSTGDLQFLVKIKGFEFWSQLLQEHFNENYMESDKFPNSVFKGKVTNMDKVNVDKDGSYPVNVKGTLEIHGVKKDVESNGTMKVVGGNISASSEFTVVLEDYKIAIPRVVKDKLSKTAIIKINCTLSIAK
jgi:hypothetical protein